MSSHFQTLQRNTTDIYLICLFDNFNAKTNKQNKQKPKNKQTKTIKLAKLMTFGTTHIKNGDCCHLKKGLIQNKII